MSRRESKDLRSFQDGTSQRSRYLKALDPQRVAIDGRRDADLLAFVQKLCQQLLFREPDGATEEQATTKPAQSWAKFATPPAGLALSPADMASAIDDPERFSGEAAAWLGRPHFALLLTCIALLRHLRDQQNGITRRHLDHYYREQLGMAPLPARPDRVAVLFRLARGAQAMQLPAGTRLKAGKDSRGVNREYRTEEELVIRRTRVSELRTLHVDRPIATLDSLCRVRRTLDEERANFELALRLALGEPAPGDPVPGWTDGMDSTTTTEINATVLAGWKDDLDLCQATLHLHQQELRELMRLVLRRTDEGSDQEWERINQLLGLRSKPAKPRDFINNLTEAITPKRLDFENDSLSQVNSVDDLYLYSDNKAVESYIKQKMIKLADPDATDQQAREKSAFNNFNALMAIKKIIDADWREIHRLLEQAGRRARPSGSSWRLKLLLEEPENFDAMVKEALGSEAGSQTTAAELKKTLTDYNTKIRAMEKHLSMPVERIQVVVNAAAKLVNAKGLTPTEWERLRLLLSAAHRERSQASGRTVLQRWLETLKVENGLLIDQLVSLTLKGLGLKPARNPEAAWEWQDAQAVLAPQLSTGQLAVLIGFRRQLENPGIEPRRFSWEDVLGVLEFAQRRIANAPDPVPCTKQWRNLVVAADARAQRLDSGGWATFGRRSVEVEAEPPEPNLGFALVSPLLGLSQGHRTLTLSLAFASAGFDPAIFQAALAKGMDATSALVDHCNANLLVRVSGAKGWVPLNIAAASLGPTPITEPDSLTTAELQPSPATPAKQTLKLTIQAPVSDPSFTPPEGEAFPMLQVLLRPKWDSAGGMWITTGAFELVRVEALHLEVAVVGLSDLVLQQEDRRLDAKKPFEPFGAQPNVGSRFYLSHPELIRNRLNSLTFHLEWTGLSKALSAQYFNYRAAPLATDFQVQIELIDQQRSLEIGTDSVQAEPEGAKVAQSAGHALPSDDSQDGGVQHSLFELDSDSAATPGRTITLFPRGIDYVPRPALESGTDLRQDSRLWQWTLKPIDFGHSRYPALAAAKGRELAVAIAQDRNNTTAESFRVDPPYTPKLKKLTVDYTASLAINLMKQEIPPGSDVLHVHPFGLAKISQGPAPILAPLLFPSYPWAGELLIGLADADLPQRLSLLVQLAEGTSDPDAAPATLRWQILDGESWSDLTVCSDDTAGFLHSGLVVLELPPVAPSRLLPAELRWLRVTIETDPSSVCDCINLHAQAVMASFHDQGNAADHYATPLQPFTIKGLVAADGRIAAIEQPYSSFGGRPVEPEKDLDRRVSEGLRHKQRALAAWDYERLVLEEFGSRIHKVKCLAGDAPGGVDVIVIPNLRGALPADPLAPKAPANVLGAIRQFLQSRTPASASVRVRNARFEQVRIRVGVRFQEGQDENFCRQQLTADLMQFLCPWANDEGAEITISNTIYATSIVAFVDHLPYVDYVAQIHLFLLDGNGNSIEEQAGLGAAIKARSPDVVLVSARAHRIDVISPLGLTAESLCGIGYMQIEFDFIIAPTPEPPPAPP